MGQHATLALQGQLSMADDDKAKVVTERARRGDEGVGHDRKQLQPETATPQLPLLLPVFPYEVLATFRHVASDNLAGLHTLSAWGTTSERGTSALVAMHEDLHDRILSTTAFGYVQRWLRSHLQPQVPVSWKRFATKWLAALDQESAHAHEVAATYLPIKHLRLEEQADALAQLPPQYREYYDTLARVIDRHAKSSYVQFVIAETIVFSAFHSPILLRIAGLARETKPSITPEESPNRRLERLCALLDGDGGGILVESLQRELATTARERGLQSFNANSEMDWVTLPRPLISELDHVLVEYVAQWFADRSYGGVPAPDVREIADAAEALLEPATQHGVIIGDAEVTADFNFLGADNPARIVFAAADSVFFNIPIADLTRMKRIPKKKLWVTVKNPPGTIAVICGVEACGPQLAARWFVRTCGNTGNCSTLLVTQQQLGRFLAWRAEVYEEKGAYVDNDLYVIGLPAPVNAEARALTMATMRAALSMFSTKRLKDKDWTFSDITRSAHFLGLHRVVFYMHGNLLAWTRFIGSFDGARYFTYLQLEDRTKEPQWAVPRGGISLATFPEGAGVHVLRFADGPMTFIRVQNTWASHWLTGAIAEYADASGRITVLTGNEDEVVRSEKFVNLAVSSVEAVWTVF